MNDQLGLFEEEFSVPKVSVLNTLSFKWKNRKRWWTDTYKIQSELGRGEDYTGNTRVVFGEERSISIFDPVLCELMYKWFAVPSGSVLDPFAGGSVRGIVAEELGYRYTGIELLPEQVEANMLQSDKPTWLAGDSNQVLDSLSEKYDFLFSCPPYYDLEVYSNKEEDLSNQTWNEFRENYKSIIKKSIDHLAEDSFACFVITEVRERDRTGRYCEGYYRNLIPLTVEAFEEAGARFYNDLILYTSPQVPSMLSKKVYNQSSKIMSTHQNVLVFVKGNPNFATFRVQQHQGRVCEVEGKEFPTAEHAGISLQIGAHEANRRIDSKKIKWINWNWKDEKKFPEYKIEIEGYLFESYVDAKRFLPLSEQEIRSRVLSSQRQYRHYILLEEPITDKDYLENEKELLSVDISLELPTINCEGKEYFSIKDAAKDLGVSGERVRQKLKSSKYTDYIFL